MVAETDTEVVVEAFTTKEVVGGVTDEIGEDVGDSDSPAPLPCGS